MKIVHNCNFTSSLLSKVREGGHELIYDEILSYNENDLIDFLKDVDGIIINNHVSLSDNVINNINLKFIIKYGLDFHLFNEDVLNKNDIKFYSITDPFINTAAEHILSNLLFYYKDLDILQRKMNQIDSIPKEIININEESNIKSLVGKRIGIIGINEISKRLIDYIKVFNSEIVYYDDFEKTNYKLLTLKKLLQTSDIIIIFSSPLIKTLISKEEIDLMKDDVFLMNFSDNTTAINENDLYHNIDKFQKVILDTIRNYPHIKSELLESDKIIISPHIKQYSDVSQSEAEQQVLNIINIYN